MVEYSCLSGQSTTVLNDKDSVKIMMLDFQQSSQPHIYCDQCNYKHPNYLDNVALNSEAALAICISKSGNESVDFSCHGSGNSSCSSFTQ